jgi:hypothetical protein
MKTPKQIEKLIKDSVYKEVKADNQSDKYFENAWMVWWGLMDTDFMNGIIKAFTKCQEDSDKKYTIKEVERYHDIRATQGISNANK